MARRHIVSQTLALLCWNAASGASTASNADHRHSITPRQ